MIHHATGHRRLCLACPKGARPVHTCETCREEISCRRTVRLGLVQRRLRKRASPGVRGAGWDIVATIKPVQRPAATCSSPKPHCHAREACCWGFMFALLAKCLSWRWQCRVSFGTLSEGRRVRCAVLSCVPPSRHDGDPLDVVRLLLRLLILLLVLVLLRTARLLGELAGPRHGDKALLLLHHLLVWR